MARIGKSNGEDKLALSKKELTATFDVERPDLAAQKRGQKTQRTASASFSAEYQDVINHCIDVFYRHHGIRLSRSQALDHILHSWVAID